MGPLNLLQSSSEYICFYSYALSSCRFLKDFFFKDTELQGLETGISVDVSLVSTTGGPPAKPRLGFQSPDTAYVQMQKHMPCPSAAGLGAET